MPTHIGPVHVTIDPGGATEFIISREHQLEDATLVMNDMMSDHQSQESGAAIDKSFTGFEANLELSIGEVGLDFFRRATNPGRYTVNTTTPTQRKLDYGDLTGLRVPKKRVLLKLYEGLLPTTNTDLWFTFLHAGFEVEMSLAFGRETQTAYTMRIVAYPDPATRYKVIRGDVSTVGTGTGLGVGTGTTNNGGTTPPTNPTPPIPTGTETEPTAINANNNTDFVESQPITLTAVV